MERKFAIGDKVYRASQDVFEKWDTCPDCGGTCALKVVMFDQTEHSIPCAGCSAGYLGAQGVVRRMEHGPSIEGGEVTGVVMEQYRGLVYILSTGYHVQAEDVFATAEEAAARAEVKAEQFNKEERERVFKKKDNNRTWSWHVRYYRRQIREAKETIERATQLLDAAKQKAKEPAEAA